VTDEAQRSVLVTGAAGFVGRRLAATLAAAGWRVTGLDLAPPPAEDGAFDAFWRGDLLDEGAMAELSAGASFQAVVHLAGLVGHAGRRELFAVNVGGTSAALAHLARPECHLVFFSTGLVYGDQPGPFTEATPCRPCDPYGQSKLAAEALVGAWAGATRSPVAVLRPSVIYGPGAPEKMLLVSLLATLRRGEPFAMTGGEQLRDFVHVDDVARAVRAVLEQRAHGTWNLASGESHTVRAAAELGAVVAGRGDLLRVGALPYRRGEVFDYRLDAGGLRRAVGWQPHVSLAAGLERLWGQLS
jgi:UDP-glucose 4-epimerase